jgi:cysteine-rich repeat protein
MTARAFSQGTRFATAEDRATLGRMRGGRLAVMLATLVACGDNRVAPVDSGTDSISAGDAPAADAHAGDACTTNCGSAAVCGNQVVENGEECDEGVPGLSSDGCSSTCTVESLELIDTNPPTMQLHSRQAMAYDEAHHVVVMFGGLVSEAGAPGTPVDETWEWDGSTWTLRTPMVKPPPLVDAAMVYDSVRQRIVMFGGLTGTGPVGTWEWDGVEWEEQFPAHSPPLRTLPGLAFDRARGVTVLVGGSVNGMKLDDTWEWDGTDWTERLDAPSVFAGELITYAGSRGVMFCPDPTCQWMWAWDGASWSQIVVPHGPLDPYLWAMDLAYDSIDDRVLALNSAGGGYAEIWAWDGQTWTRFPANADSPARPDVHIAFDSDREVLVKLGVDHETWEWNGAWWRTGDDTLPARELATATYDARRGVVVGMDYHVGKTLEWDGTAWSARSPAHSPSVRANTKLAYDEARGVTVLYGGSHDLFESPWRAYFTDTWEWDGTDWLQRFPLHHPPETVRVVTAYDAKKRVVLTYVPPDLWAWDGNDWSLLPTSHHPSDYCVDLSYDVMRDMVLCMTYMETWEWDGTDWLARTPAHVPIVGAQIYNPLRHRTQLVSVNPQSIWEWDGTDWSAVPATPQNAWGLAGTYDRIHDEILFEGGGRWEPWLSRWRDDQPREACDGGDVDGDGLVGCADPDCWGHCNPLCIPGTTCDPNDPHCGDGTCSSIESHAICPADCP